MVYGTNTPQHIIRVKPGVILCSNLPVRDKFALIGPGGISVEIQPESDTYGFRAPGITSLDLSRSLPEDTIGIYLVNDSFVPSVIFWIDQFIDTLYMSRIIYERKLQRTRV